MLDAEYKVCNQCGQTLPIEAFHCDVGSADGRRNVCAACRKLQQQLEKEATVDDAFHRLQERGVQQLMVLASGGSKVPHMAELYEGVVEAFGGARAFCQHLVALYFNPKTSAAVKARILEKVLMLSRSVSESGAISRDLESFTDEDLKRSMEERLRRAVSDKWQELRVAPQTMPVEQPQLPLIPGYGQEGGDAQRVG